jgi:type 1 glutamine amidotransferase
MRTASCVIIVVVAALVACSSSSRQPDAPVAPTNPSPSARPLRVMMLTATAGFRHGSIDTARQVMAGLAASPGTFSVTAVDDARAVTGDTLANQDVLFFALTTGELPFSGDQKAAILAFVSRGGGFIGVHSATDTLYGWPEYGSLVGAYFNEHPWTQRATVVVEDTSHPTTASLGERFSIEEEFYTFRDNPRPRVHVLLRLDAASVGASGDYPLAWTRMYGSGRVYYNALGHFPETWLDRRFQDQIAAAITWAAGTPAQ